jgi:PAS domain S-box-containing protein
VGERVAGDRANFVRAPIPMLILDAKAFVTDVSDRCLDLLGFAHQEVVGRHISEFQDHASAYQAISGWGELLVGARSATWSGASFGVTAPC